MPDRSYLAWPFFEERHRALKVELDAFAAGLGELAHDDRDVDATCRALVRRLGDAGPAARSAASSTCARCAWRARRSPTHGGLPDFAFAMQGLGSGAVTLFGSEEQRATLLPRVVAGEAIAAFALSEPRGRLGRRGARDDARAPTATATSSTARRPGSPTAASPTSTSSSRAPARRRARAASRRSSSTPTRPGCAVAERIEVIAPHPLATLVFDGVPRRGASA